MEEQIGKEKAADWICGKKKRTKKEKGLWERWRRGREEQCVFSPRQRK